MDEEVLQEIVYGNEDCSCVSENDQRGGSLIPDQDETQVSQGYLSLLLGFILYTV